MAADSARNTALAEQPAALIDERSAPAVRTTAATLSQDIAIAQIRPSPTNPRTTFGEEAMAALTASVAEHGILEPLVVRRRPDSTTAYELIAGERRWRAAQAAGLTTVPCRVAIGIDDRQALELQALENLQRADLNPVEEAQTFRQLAEAGLTQSAIARTVGKSQPYVANRLRILDLPPDVRDLIRDGKLTAAHGVSLARFSAFPAIASKIAELAVSKEYTTKALEAEKLPFSWNLEQHKLVVALYSYAAGFDTTVCKSCPFQAYRVTSGSTAWCLKPDHAAELKAAAQAEHAEQQDAITANAATTAPAVVHTETLPRDAYLEIHDWSRPTSCTSTCPCAGQAVRTYEGAPRLTPICTDPERYAQLQTEARDAAARQRQETYEAHLLRALSVIKAEPAGDDRALALLVMAALADVDRDILERAAVRQTAGRATPPEPPDRWLPDHERDAGVHAMLDQLAAIDGRGLVRLATDALLADELSDRYLSFRQTATPLTSWYLRDAPAAETAPDADEVDDEDDDYPRPSDFICERCGESIIVQSADEDRTLADDAINTPFPVVCLRDCTPGEATP